MVQAVSSKTLTRPSGDARRGFRVYGCDSRRESAGIIWHLFSTIRRYRRPFSLRRAEARGLATRSRQRQKRLVHLAASGRCAPPPSSALQQRHLTDGGMQAMSQENVEIVRRIYDAGNRVDWNAVFRDASQDLGAFMAGPNVGTHRGRDEVQAAFEDLVSGIRVLDHGAGGVLPRRRSIGRPSSTIACVRGARAVRFELSRGHIWTIRDGIVLSMSAPTPALKPPGYRSRRVGGERPGASFDADRHHTGDWDAVIESPSRILNSSRRANPRAVRP